MNNVAGATMVPAFFAVSRRWYDFKALSCSALNINFIILQLPGCS
jgi:hypothetical protein